MRVPVYERIFAVSVNDLDKYITEPPPRYYVLKFDKKNNIYFIGEVSNDSIPQ